MIKFNFLHVVFLTIILGSGCSKNEPPNVAEKKASSNNQSDLNPEVNNEPDVNNDPNTKFTAQHTSINSFETSNTFNNYGFAYRYESRSGDAKEHFYKSIQEFMANDITNQRDILAETWVEISKQEYLQTKQHYDQTRELSDLNPKILQSTPIYQKFLQFLEEQQVRQAQFEKKRADFDAEFERSRADFDTEFERKRAEFNKNWNEPTQSAIKSKDEDTTHKNVIDDIQITQPEFSDEDSERENSSAL